MSIPTPSPLRFGVLLALLNVLAWCVFLAARAPYTPGECEALRQRSIQTKAESAFGQMTSDQDHLLFRRPIHSGWNEPPYTKALILPNFMPLLFSFALAAGDLAYYPGPTCSQSYLAGLYFFLLASLQWFFVGAGFALCLQLLLWIRSQFRSHGPA